MFVPNITNDKNFNLVYKKVDNKIIFEKLETNLLTTLFHEISHAKHELESKGQKKANMDENIIRKLLGLTLRREEDASHS